MIKVNKEVIVKISSRLQELVEPFETVNAGFGDLPLKVYNLDELSLNLSEDEKIFVGFTFEALGRLLLILPNFSLFITVVNDNDTVETFEVTDEKFVELIEEFLWWRLKTLTAFT